MDSNVDIDFSEISQENIDDEVLISVVKENSVLYDKSLKDYKNKELKLEIWKNIGEVLGCTVSKQKGVGLLCNTFTKKLRERKAGRPSGSEWKMAKMWVYFKQMSFLTPHIAHQMQVTQLYASKKKAYKVL
ncbi:transcription factor adf-1 [Lasius niger]|uniref:Transcription factor adf-1 n=1 Tax=Lasius niger TaxID=67767 RepID=A0A0J7KG45_LASNI|nr:transcription factor adf-1 [Lasius niger]